MFINYLTKQCGNFNILKQNILLKLKYKIDLNSPSSINILIQGLFEIIKVIRGLL